MIVLWNGNDLFKGYYDPETGWLDLVSSRPAEGGQAWTVGEEFSLSVDETGAFCHLGLNIESARSESPLVRPAEARRAVDAEVEVIEDHAPQCSFDSSAGTLSVRFGGADVLQWGRLGDNLLWLALDDQGYIAGLVFEGVSRDPGGKGQSTWLEEVGL